MSRATFFGLEIGRTGLAVSQVGLDVTGHNIANVDTLGYTRQRIIQTAYEPNAIRGKVKPLQQALVGGGTLIQVHDQIRSAFLDRQFRTEQSLYSYWETRSQGLTFVQSKFEDGEAQLSLSNNIKKLFQSFLTETTDTDSTDPRVIVRENAETMILQFKTLYSELIDLQAGQDTSFVAQIDQINTMAANIASLNDSIYRYELLSGEYANDLRDKRNLLLDQLSGIADITYETASDGQFTVKLAGHTLVDHLTVNKLGVKEVSNTLTGEDPVHTAYWLDDNSNLDFTKLKGGTLKSTKDLRDEGGAETPGIPYFIEKLNNLIRAIVQEVNDQHRQGWTYPANEVDSEQGINFFECADSSDVTDLANVTVKNVVINSKIVDNVNYIASSSEKIITDPSDIAFDPEKLVEGNNENMKAIANIIKEKNISITIDKGTGPETIVIGDIEGFLSGIGLDVFTALRHTDDTLDSRQIQLIDVDNQRQALSGVSLDEEMTNLIKYTHAYNGAARVITAMDDAIDLIVNRMGRVGL